MRIVAHLKMELGDLHLIGRCFELVCAGQTGQALRTDHGMDAPQLERMLPMGILAAKVEFGEHIMGTDMLRHDAGGLPGSEDPQGLEGQVAEAAGILPLLDDLLTPPGAADPDPGSESPAQHIEDLLFLLAESLLVGVAFGVLDEEIVEPCRFSRAVAVEDPAQPDGGGIRTVGGLSNQVAQEAHEHFGITARRTGLLVIVLGRDEDPPLEHLPPLERDLGRPMPGKKIPTFVLDAHGDLGRGVGGAGDTEGRRPVPVEEPGQLEGPMEQLPVDASIHSSASA